VPGTWIGLAVGVLAGFVLVAFVANLTNPPASTGPSTTPPAAASAITSSGPTETAAQTPEPTATEPTSHVLVGAGDIASCTTGGDAATANLLDEIPGTVVVLGDSVYPDGTHGQFADCYGPTWGRFLDRTRPAPGNHEYHTTDAAGYFGYFGARAGDPDEGWYAYDLGEWRIYALNSNCAEIGGCDPGSAQVRWLAADLAANPRRCVLAYWHHPRFSSGRHGSNPAVDTLWDTLYDAGAELVLNGHDHSYERFAPQSDAGRLDPDAGIVEFVVGTGGYTHYEFPNVLATSLVRDNAAFGVLQLTLSQGSWTARFVPIAGQSFSDEASGRCH
jgi:hypothetical protein